MKKFLEKIIALIVIISLFLSLGLNVFLFRPKPAKALDAGAGWVSNIKDYVLDAVSWVISNMMLKRLEQNIQDWGAGKKSKIQLPFGIEDFKDYFDEFLNIASAKFLDQFKNTQLCTGISFALGQAPNINLTTLRSNLRSVGRFSGTFGKYYIDQPTYQRTAMCTLDKVVGNIESFLRRPRITIFGWDAWKALNQPQNNIFGAFFSALDLKTQIAAREIMNAANQAAVSGGYKNQTVTTANSKDKCTQDCLAFKSPSCETGLSNEACRGNSDCGVGYVCFNNYCVSQDCAVETQSCINNCGRIPVVPIAQAVSNLGSHIHEAINNSLSGDMQKLIATDEITELIGIFFSALLNKAMNGLGLAFKSFTATKSQQQRAQNKDRFSYQKQFLKTTSSTEKKDVRTSIYSTIEQAIKQFSRSIIACSSDTMMTVEDYRKNLADILDSNVEALYVGIQGVNLQPDAVVLDPPYAPYSVYGYSWGEVFPSKVPEKCRALLDQLNMPKTTTCSSIITGLEPNYGLKTTSTALPQCSDGKDNDNNGLIDYPNDPGCYSPLDTLEASGGGGGGGGGEREERVVPMMDLVPGIGEVPCIPCIYDHDALNCPVGPRPPQKYPTTFFGTSTNTVWTSAILQQKLDFYGSCAEWYVVALNRCDECLKGYDENCAKLATEQERANCINQQCNNYSDIVEHVIDPPTTPLDFYGKCLAEEQKEACFTCLKEYYIPATYCEQVRDYTARLVTKYPTVVVNKYKKDEGEFRGLFDPSIAARGGLCNDNDGKENISLALICRAMPDFAYNGEKVCQTRCKKAGMTDEQLTNVTDFRPDENDCGGIKLDVGGKEPFNSIDDGTLDGRGRCCADFWQKNTKNYTICVGAGPTTENPPPIIPTMSVTLSANPSSGLAPLNGVDLTAVVSGTSSGQNLTYYFDCENDGNYERVQESALTTLTVSDLCNYSENNKTYTASVMVMNDVGASAKAVTTIQTTDCEISVALNPANGIAPVDVSITGKLNNASGPFTFQFYCDVPTSGGPVDSWSGATTQYTSDINEYTLNNACRFTSGGLKAVGVSIQGSNSSSSCYQTITIAEPATISCILDVLEPTIKPNTPVEVSIETMPNAGYLDLIHNAVGTNFSIDCTNNGSFEFSDTIQQTTLQNSTCSYSAPGIYTISAKVGNTNPANGFSAYNTCQGSVRVELREETP